MNRLNRYCDGVMEAAWLMVLIAVPLYINIYSTRPFDVDKLALFRTIVWVAAAAWLIKIFNEGGLKFVHVQRPASIKDFLRTPLALPVVGLASVYLVSTLLSLDLGASILGSYDRFDGVLTRLSFILLFLLVAANLRRHEQVERLLLVLVLTSFPIGVYAVLQHYDLDPYQWGRVAADRSISTVGHPIFAAAYLSMAFFIVASRAILAFHSHREKKTGSAIHLIRALLYSFIALLNLVAIWFTFARGPFVGLLVGIFVFVLALLAYWRWKKLFYAFAAAAVLGLVFLTVLNIPGGPLASLRDKPGMRAISRVFETTAGTGQTRSLIWLGMSRVVSPHAPLLFPDQTTDKLDFVRPFLGYGAESIKLAYESYYIPELFILETRNVIYDRAHNEFWDLLVQYGVLGFIAEYGFFLTLSFYALKWLGFISAPYDRNLYWILSLVGGALGGGIAIAVMGIGFLGIGLPVGLLLGTPGVLIYRIFCPIPTDQNTPLWKAMTIIGILSAVLSHCVEILFGISIGSTLTLLWALSAVLVIIGWVKPQMAPLAAPKNEKKGAVVEVGWNQVLINAGFALLIMSLLTLDFIRNSRNEGSAMDIIVGSLTRVLDEPSYGILWMLLGTAFMTVLILYLETAAYYKKELNLASLLAAVVSAEFIFGLLWLIRASQITAVTENSGLDLDSYLDLILRRLVVSYIGLFVVMLVWAVFLMEQGGNVNKKQRAAIGIPQIAACLALPAIAIAASFTLNITPVYANILFKEAAAQAQSSQQYDTSLYVMDKAIALAPYEDFYLNSARKVAMEFSRVLSDPDERKAQVARALEYAKKGYKVNPLFAERMVDIAVTQKELANLTQDPAEQSALYDEADILFANAISVKPTKPEYWTEWANLLVIKKDFEGAQEKIETALSLDPNYEAVQQAAGRIYQAAAEQETAPTKREDLFNRALAAYQTSVSLAESRGEVPSRALASIINIQEALGQYEAARQTCLKVIALGIGEERWKVYEKLADLSDKLGDRPAQGEYLKQAIDIAPEEEKPGLQAKLDALAP